MLLHASLGMAPLRSPTRVTPTLMTPILAQDGIELVQSRRPELLYVAAASDEAPPRKRSRVGV